MVSELGSPSGEISPDSRKRSSLGCRSSAELADLVEEEGAFAGGADQAELVAVGAGEGAAAVAEQLALEQVARDGGAVERDEGLCRRGPEKSWIARARISLPVPLSPVMRTLTFVRAMRRASFHEDFAHSARND